MLCVLSYRSCANECVMRLQCMTRYKIASMDDMNEYVLLFAIGTVTGMPALPACAAHQIHPKAPEDTQ